MLEFLKKPPVTLRVSAPVYEGSALQVLEAGASVALIDGAIYMGDLTRQRFMQIQHSATFGEGSLAYV